MPDEDIAFDRPGPRPHDVQGRLRAGLRRSCARAASPLYTLANPVDDADDGQSPHVLRGEDLLCSTPRQVVLYRALMEHRHRAQGDAASSGTCRT